jgi:hypothetical protein
MWLPYHRRGRRSRGADPEASGRRASGRGRSPSVSGRRRRRHHHRRRRLRRPARGPTCSARPGTSRPRVCPRPTSLSVAAPAIGPGAARYRPNARARARYHARRRSGAPPARRAPSRIAGGAGNAAAESGQLGFRPRRGKKISLGFFCAAKILFGCLRWRRRKRREPGRREGGRQRGEEEARQEAARTKQTRANVCG